MSRIRTRRLLPAALSLSLACFLPATRPFAAPTRLTFARRLAAQEALERVYWKHRTWPAGDVSKRREFAQAVPAAVIRARVEDYLRKSEALDRIWHRPITAAQLQAEIDRMAAKTRAPEVLRELFEALDDDPDLIGECLARPHLADRLIHDWYAYDGRFHTEARAKAEKGREALERGVGVDRLDAVVTSIDEDSLPEGASGESAPQGGLREDREAFSIRVSRQGPGQTKQEWVASWAKRPFDDWWKDQAGAIEPREPDTAGGLTVPATLTGTPCTDDTWSSLGSDVPSPRMKPSAVWTGSEMIVWGGYNYQSYLNTGGRYDPATDTWTLFHSDQNLLPGRYDHAAVWTGTEMIIWGGFDGSFRNDGARYNPVTGGWTPMTITASTPAGRTEGTVVWTGTEMIVWGGYAGGTYFRSGARYNPATDTWVPTSEGANWPAARSGHVAVWTGTEMIIWGGHILSSIHQSGGRYNPTTDTWTPTRLDASTPEGHNFAVAFWTGTEMLVWGGSGYSGYVNTGARYNPVTDTWTYMPADYTTPAARVQPAAVWTGTEMIIWGGKSSVSNALLTSGGRYDPVTGTWTPTRDDATTPNPRWSMAAVWTGSEMIVFGGELPLQYVTYNTGGRYDPASDTWVPLVPSALNPEARTEHTAVWTGNEMLIWGGRRRDGTRLQSGGAYEPATGTWRALPIDAATPAARRGHTAVWTGTEMIIWGGGLAGGGRYDPASDSWSPVNTGAGSPPSLTYSTAVWTGREMIVWGGATNGSTGMGGRYDPSTDTWTPVSSGPGAPGARQNHTAVWTGTEMIVWGGRKSGYLGDGARYDPVADLWSPMSVVGAPSPRIWHAAVWTGTEMIVWGGYEDMDLDDGARYDPALDSWAPVAYDPVSSPARSAPASVWTGNEMIVWGGAFGSAGARYDPASDTWTATAQDWTTPSGRSWPSAVWDGSRMLVWGGENSTTVLGDGEGYCSCTGDPSAIYYLDHDGDGRGDPATGTVHACGQPPGWSKLPTDCDDDDNTIFGGALQRCDGINNDCDDPGWPAMPADEADDDLDGQRICGGDCDDAAPSVYAGAPQLCDGINNDCNDPGWPSLTGTNEVDDDGDALSECAGDCDDTRASVYPGAPQICDGLNNDCNDPTWPAAAPGENDDDSDGWPPCAGDCDDTQASVYPGAPQLCDGLNNDCSDPGWPAVAADEADADHDGWRICAGDCDDAEPAVYPWAPQLCDGLNNDCSDPGWPSVPADETDADGDGRRICDDDCDDGNDQVWAVPGYVNDLAMSVTPQQYIQLSWSQPADPGAVSVTYDVIRSGINNNYTTAATCVETDDGSDTTALDATPLPTQVYFFLVRVRNGCPGGTAVAPDSSGQPRAVRTCP